MKWQRVFLALVGILLIIILGWLFLPHIVGLLPGGVQARLPHAVLEMVSTPLPTALPAPATAVATPRLSVISEQLSLINEQLQATPTSLPATNTPMPAPLFPDAPIASPTSPATLLPSSTATVTPSPTIVAHSPPPAAAHLDGLRIAPQKLNNCGPTNLSIVLSYLGEQTEQLQVAGVVKPNKEDRNVSPADMVAYVNEQTPLRARAFVGGDLDLLKRLIAAGYPVIIEKGLLPSAWEGWMGHYLTLFGYDDAAQEFVGLDTFLGPWDSSGRSETYAATAEFWEQFNNTLIVVYPAAEETAVFDLLPPSFGNPVTMWQRAAQLAEQSLRINPNNPFAWFNLGSSLTELAELTHDEALFQTAVGAFDQARQIGLPWRMLWYQFGPYRAYLAAGRADEVLELTNVMLQGGGFFVEETHLYRGLALADLGQEWASQDAYRQAHVINPNSLLLSSLAMTPVGVPAR